MSCDDCDCGQRLVREAIDAYKRLTELEVRINDLAELLEDAAGEECPMAKRVRGLLDD